ncbi:MAG TPA: phytoene desaturase family protein [Gemmatimonadales bacterium]|nr:phytoene desaturase family protein [Gemmatimonadales bacterium]
MSARSPVRPVARGISVPPVLHQPRRRVIVIGAGLGGLATAARLAHAGYRVTVLERHALPGGRAGLWESEGFRFDTGPSLVLMVEYWEQLFRDVGRRLQDYVTLVQIDPNYRIHYPDGSSLEITSRINQLLANLERLEPGVTDGMLRFLARSGEMYRKGLAFIDRNLHPRGSMFSLAHLSKLLGSGALGGLRRMVANYVRDERLRDALTFQSLYLGLSPYESLAIYSLLPYAEIAGGLYYPMGGIHRLSSALAQLAEESGAELQYGARVARIERAGRRVTGVLLEDGTRLEADLIVSNADLPYTYASLLGEPYPGIEGREFSCSVLLMYLGVARRYPGLLHHNLVVPPRMRDACEDIFRRHTMPDEPPFYVCAPSRTDPSVAPSGCENLFVLVLAPSQDPARPIDWSIEGCRVESAMLTRLERFGLTDLRRHLVTRRLFTPDDFSREFGNLRGEAFGLAHGVRQIGYFRPHNRHARLANMYFVGQSTHPGCGLPMVLISARCVAERVLAEQPV